MHMMTMCVMMTICLVKIICVEMVVCNIYDYVCLSMSMH